MLTSYPSQLPPLYDTAPYIVVGSGIAGLAMALELSKHQRVILITKSSVNESNTTYAQGGIASALDLHDSPELHYQDTMMAGAGLCDPEAVLALVYDGPERVRHLIDIGVPFDRDSENNLSLTREAAHSRRRILHANGDATGRAITQTLIRLVVNSPQITVYENHFGLGLATVNGRCCGLVALFQNEPRLFLSSVVALCTGGLGQIYGSTTNPPIATGDGMALAYLAGARLKDLEFVQFHPTALALPPAPPFLISETVRGEGAILLNGKGHRFMPEYHPLAELAPRDIVARGIFAEIQKGNQPVYLDLSKIPPATVRSRFPNIYETCLRYRLDISANPIPVAPAAHYVMGGVETDLFGRTAVPGLFAAGETACTGVHGANRLASNSLLEGLVFGGRAADYLKEQPITIPEISEEIQIHYPPRYTEYADMAKDYGRLRELTDNFLGIVRNATGLSRAKEQLESISAAVGPFAWDPAYFELQNMFLLASLMFDAALTRTESRGGHYRDDYPQPHSHWRKHIVFHQSTKEVIG